jgi:molybdopterin synthase catalytic subunit
VATAPTGQPESAPAYTADAAAPVPARSVRTGSTWVALLDGPLPFAEAMAWATSPDCGAVVTFTGTVRDHADGRAGVTQLTYEAYEEPALARLTRVAEDTLARWPEVRRLAIAHRVGSRAVGEPAVIVVASAPHRDAAFEAARHAIDTTKATVPIWKHEEWDGGAGWGLGAQELAGP